MRTLAARLSMGLLLFLGLSEGMDAAGGDKIRSRAPMTALVLDLREGNLRPLERAYFRDEIDFFLEYQGASGTAARDLYYLREAGRAVEAGDIGRARTLLRNVRQYPDQKNYLEAVLQAAEGRHESAFRIFEEMISQRRRLDRRLVSLATMAAARVAHEVGDYSKAIFFYNRIGQLDPFFFQSIFEKAWSFYLNGDMNGALGASLSFKAPYANTALFPEAFIVRAAAFYHLCLFDRANESIEQMRRAFVPIHSQVRELLQRDPNTWLFDDRFLSTINPRLLGYMVQDGSFRKLQRAYLRLRREPARLSGGDANLAEQALRFVQARLAREALRVLRKADEELKKALDQADSIQIEILQLGVNVLVGAPIEMREDIRTIQLGNVDFDQQIQFWPFKGEFWLDELGAYYYGLRSACGQTPLASRPVIRGLEELAESSKPQSRPSRDGS